DQIFKVNSYDEGLTLRGIYFCGDSGINLELTQLTATPDKEDLTEDYIPIEGSREDATPVIKLKIGELEKERPDDLPTKIFFIDDLLRQKIFFETGLAQPIRQRLISANRNLMIAKVSIAGFIGVSTIGLFHAYDRITSEREYLLPVLDKINNILRELPQTQVDQSQFMTSKLDTQTRQLLEMMMNVHKADFFSVFFPSSWFSPINDNLRSVLKASYNQIIIRAVHMDLLIKARDLLTLRPKATDLTISLASQLQPVTTVEYQLFKSFAEQFIELYQNVEKFNRLKENSDPILVRELVQYSLGLTLPEEFNQNYEHFRRVFQEHPYPKIDLKLYQGAAQETLKILYTHFLTNLFSPQIPNSIIGKINFVLGEFGNQQQEGSPNVEILRKIAFDLSETIPILGVPGNNWIDALYFDPGGGFADLMAQISGFPLFGPSIVEQFAADTATHFHQFQRELMQLNNVLVDRSQVSPDKPIYPSQGLIELQKNLATLFSESFMAPVPAEQIIFNVPEDQVVFWNPKLIDQAIEQIQKYEEFITKHLKNFPSTIQENLKQAARRNLQNNILGLLARAQVFGHIDEDLPSYQAAEQVLQDKIANVREIVPKFIKLMEVMDKDQVGGHYVRIREMLGILSTRLLEKVEELLNGYKLYQVKEDNFNWWDGKKSPILQGFHVRDEVDLKSYLKVQRDLIMRFALDFAEPMVTFLTSKVMEGYKGNTPLVNKWKQIIEQAHGYQKRRPDNSITALENSLINDLLPINLAKCFKTIPLKSVKSSSGDYFLERDIEIKRDLLSRCEVLKRQEGLENYARMVAFFNEHLKGKFPFLTVPHTGMADAEPEDMREFFYLYKEAGDNPKAILDQIYQLGEMANNAMAFLKGMEEVKQLFEPYLKGESINATPSLDFAIEFRVNTPHEVNANLILEWFIKPDRATKITRHDKVKKGKWYYGNEVVVGFRWPEQSRLHPFRDPAQPNLEIDDQLTALFRFPSKWSLLELLKTQRASRSDFGGQPDPSPYTLKFFIHNSPTEQTVIFNRITILSPDKGKTPGKPIVLPEFPTIAPELPDEITSKADQPVLVMGAAYSHEEEEVEEGKEKANAGSPKTPKASKSETPEIPEEAGYEDQETTSE
ncbi:MAG TPA: hypothetical protein VNJ29_00905, partial [Candidatus Nitrosotenuis sp.]|nr:hypothetical protein [Candidatus Nitrosotenuis sp.]